MSLRGEVAELLRHYEDNVNRKGFGSQWHRIEIHINPGHWNTLFSFRGTAQLKGALLVANGAVQPYSTHIVLKERD